MIEVLKQALKAFEVATTPWAKDRQEVLEAVAAINQAIAELESQEPVAHMYPDDLEKFQTDETFAYAYSVEMGSPTKGETVPLYTHPKHTKVVFPTMLRKMWSGSEVQAWLDENVNKEKS